MERFQRHTPDPKASPKRRSSIGSDALSGIRNSLMKKFTYLRRSSIVSDSAQRPAPSLWIDKTQSEQNLNKSDKKSKTPSWVRPASSSFHMSRSSTLPADTRRSSTTSEFLSNHRRLYAATPGRTFICIKSRRPQEEGELKLRKGNFVEGTLFIAWSATPFTASGASDHRSLYLGLSLEVTKVPSLLLRWDHQGCAFLAVVFLEEIMLTISAFSSCSLDAYIWMQHETMEWRFLALSKLAWFSPYVTNHTFMLCNINIFQFFAIFKLH